jgi:hypothetical protein
LRDFVENLHICVGSSVEANQSRFFLEGTGEKRKLVKGVPGIKENQQLDSALPPFRPATVNFRPGGGQSSGAHFKRKVNLKEMKRTEPRKKYKFHFH